MVSQKRSRNQTFKSIKTKRYNSMFTDAFLEIASSNKTILYDFGIKSLDMFNAFLEDNINKLSHLPKKKQTPLYVGGVCLQELIVEKINKLKSSKKVNKIQIEERLSYFKSEAFIQNFTNALPIRDKANKSALQTSYSDFFNNLFDVNYKGWREDKLSKIDNQTQCRRALGIKPNEKIVDIQETGKIVCYLCGRKILSSRNTNQKTMECEHVLPIITALSHWWLVKDKIYTSSQIKNLSYEYDWSHRCCNQIKSNIDFIVYDSSSRGNFEYRVNMPMINLVLEKIANESVYDCKAIKTKINLDQNIKIAKKIKPMIDEINSIASNFNSHSEYLLLTKFKVISALSNDDFMDAIINNDTDDKIHIPKRKDKSLIIKAKRELIKKMEEEQKRELILKIQMQTIERQNRLSRKQGGMNGKTSDELLDDLSDDEILEYELSEYNEFEDSNDSVLVKTILTSKYFEPTFEELTNTFERVFVNNIYIQWDPNTDAAHYFYVDDIYPTFTANNKLHGLLPKNTINTSIMPTHRETLKRRLNSDEIDKARKTGNFPPRVLYNNNYAYGTNKIQNIQENHLHENIN